MPIARLEYNLPEEQEEFKVATEAMSWKAAMQEIDGEMRKRLKYNCPPKAVADEVDRLRQFLAQTLNDSNLSLWD